MAYHGYSEIMDVDPFAAEPYQSEHTQKTSGAIARNYVDSAIGTPVPEDRVARPGLAETPEALLPQGSDFADSAQKDKVDIATIEALYKSYAKSFPAPTHIESKGFNYTEYFNPHRMTGVRARHGPRLEKAKELAVALLEYYYPKEQGYRVEPAEFPLLQFGGWRTWIYPEDCYRGAKRNGDVMKTGLKQNMKLSYETWGGNINADKFHRILPEHITGFVVLNEVQYEDESTGWAQHTYLAIMMDDLDTFKHWVPEHLMQPDKNFVSMPRADILSDAMGAQAGIRTGYAIIMLGPRIEFYNYRAKPKWVEKDWEHYLGPDPVNNPDYEPATDPMVGKEGSCFSHLDGGNADSANWMVNLRTKTPTQAFDAVDRLFRSVVGRDVHYRGGYSLPGPQI